MSRWSTFSFLLPPQVLHFYITIHTKDPAIPFRTLLKVDSVTNRHTWSSPVRIGAFLTFKESVLGSKPKQLTIFTIGFVLNLAAHCRE
jgi:hypothetical protein